MERVRSENDSLRDNALFEVGDVELLDLTGATASGASLDALDFGLCTRFPVSELVVRFAGSGLSAAIACPE